MSLKKHSSAKSSKATVISSLSSLLNAVLEDEFETTMDERYISYEVYDLNEGEDDYDKYQGRQKVKHFKP